jgi:hypothetical protein
MYGLWMGAFDYGDHGDVSSAETVASLVTDVLVWNSFAGWRSILSKVRTI